MKELFVDISPSVFEDFILGVRNFCGGFVRRDLLGKCLIEKNQISLNLFS